MREASEQASDKVAFWRRLSLRDVLFLTLPPMLLASYLFFSVVSDFRRLSLYQDWWSRLTPTAWSCALRRIRPLRFALRAGDLRARISARVPGREEIRLRIDPAHWEAMTGNVPGHWGEWMKAALESGDNVQPVEVRLRGDSTTHWTTPKKSLSIKLERGELYHGQRRLNLSVKNVVQQHVVVRLAQDQDLLVPISAPVPVIVNGTFHGLHRLVGRPDESFLRQMGRMPGNVYRGEALMRGDAFKGLPRELFRSPYLWDRTAKLSRAGALDDEGLFEWIADLNGTTFEEHERLLTWFDHDELARLLAIMLIAGDPYHSSDWHNQFWYEDPSSGKMHPILWDLSVRRPGHAFPPWTINRFWTALLRDPRLLDRALDVVDAWSDEGRLRERVLELADSTEREHESELRYERMRRGVIPPVSNGEAVSRRILGNVEVLSSWTRDSRVGVHFASSPDANVLDLVALSRVGSRFDGVDFATGSTAAVEVTADSNRNGVLDSGDRSVSLTTEPFGALVRCTFHDPELLLPGCGADGPEFLPEPLLYRYFVTVLGAEGEPLTLGSALPRLRSRFSDAAATTTELEAGAIFPAVRSWHPWQYAKEPAQPIHWSGEVRLDEDVVIEASSRLVIEPGTRVLLEPNVSIVARGRVDARGEPGLPISILRADESRPWGTFALQGEGANGSRFEHVQIEGGGGALFERVEYKGSVSVYNARDVVFENCRFEANQRCDDLVNVVRSNVDMLHCVFIDANADAIDYDLSTGTIRACWITGSGNDGIDLMNCSPRILDTRIADSGDKGISVGEDSSPLIFRCEITGCVRGIEVKDHSAPVILESFIAGNETGLLQQRKSNYYAASGRAVVVGSALAGNEVDYVGLDGARVTLMNTGIGGPGPDDGAPSPSESSWVQALMGVGDAGAVRVLDQCEFVDDFRDSTDGWRPSGSVHGLRVHERDLVAVLRAGEASVAMSVDWSLPKDGSRHLLVIGAVGSGLEDARVTLVRDGEQLESQLVLDDDPGIARFTLVELPPGDYEALTLSASVDESPGELRVHGWRLLEL